PNSHVQVALTIIRAQSGLQALCQQSLHPPAHGCKRPFKGCAAMVHSAGFGADGVLAGGPANSRFVKIRDLSRGAYGCVVLALNTQTGQQVALKFIERGKENISSKYVEREIINHMKLRHPHIVELQEVFLTNTHLVLVLEYAPGGDLAEYVTKHRGLPEDVGRWFFQQLVIAVDYLHRMGVTSRDIKLENTLLDCSPRPLIKLSDFGFSKDTNVQSAPSSRVGTPAYLAPEVISNKPGETTYDGMKADIWSCGVALYAMLLNTYPFRRPEDDLLVPNQKLHAMLTRALRADYAFPPDRPLSPGVKDLIGRMLVLDPSKRASLQEIQRHPWFLEAINPAALRFNDKIVEESMARQLPAELLEGVREVVKAASEKPGAPEASTPDAVDADSADLQGEEEDCADDAGCDAAAEEDEEDDATWEFAK
ncbi:serine/threonine-protein kinase, partial [Rhizobium sp. AAP43]|uniref:serine/threonine-protein kinase n=1 Tax=Rhizobium sp. AAP43 TaxID=1523420 RepID=UPI0006CD72CD